MSTFETTANEFTSAMLLHLSGNGHRPHDRKGASPLQQQGPAGILMRPSAGTSLVVKGFFWITNPYHLASESARITTASAATMPTRAASRLNTTASPMAAAEAFVTNRTNSSYDPLNAMT